MNSLKCPHCNLTNWATEDNCKRCKKPLHDAPAFEQPSFSNAGYSAAAAGGQQAYGAPVYYPAYALPVNTNCSMAITSMVMGIVSIPAMMMLIGILIAPAAFVLGVVSLVKANKRPMEFGGKGFSIAGIATSSFALFIFVPVVAAIAIPNLLAARRSANEGAAVSAIKTIYKAEMDYRASSGAGQCGDFHVLDFTGRIPKTLANAESNGYKFRITSTDAYNCEIHAVPISPSTGSRSFMINTSEGAVHVAENKGGPASATDRVLGN